MEQDSPDEEKVFTGNRGVDAEVTMSFMCSEKVRQRIRKAAKQNDIAISEFIRLAIDSKLKEIYGQ